MQVKVIKKPRKRKKRREVFVSDLISYALISAIMIAAIWVCTPLLIIPAVNAPWDTITYVVAGILTYIFTRRFAIGLVLCYKAFAPLDVRDQCRFTPTCSTYMLMAINKYGLIIGIIKGIRRIQRCKPPNGGVDYP